MHSAAKILKAKISLLRNYLGSVDFQGLNLFICQVKREHMHRHTMLPIHYVQHESTNPPSVLVTFGLAVQRHI